MIDVQIGKIISISSEVKITSEETGITYESNLMTFDVKGNIIALSSQAKQNEQNVGSFSVNQNGPANVYGNTLAVQTAIATELPSVINEIENYLKSVNLGEVIDSQKEEPEEETPDPESVNRVPAE